MIRSNKHNKHISHEKHEKSHSQEAAMKLTRSFYSSADLCLENLDQLYDSGLYEASLNPYLTLVGQVVVATLLHRCVLLVCTSSSNLTPPHPLPEKQCNSSIVLAAGHLRRSQGGQHCRCECMEWHLGEKFCEWASVMAIRKGRRCGGPVSWCSQGV